MCTKYIVPYILLRGQIEIPFPIITLLHIYLVGKEPNFLVLILDVSSV